MPRRTFQTAAPSPLDVLAVRHRLVNRPPHASDVGHYCLDHGLVLSVDPLPATWAQDHETGSVVCRCTLRDCE